MLALDIVGKAKKNVINDKEICKAANAINDVDGYNSVKLTINIYKIVEHLKALGVVTLLVIDEFDWTRVIFHDYYENFGVLRNICSQRGFLIKTVLISRRTIKAITDNVRVGSTLHGVFDRMTVLGFTEADMNEYFQILDDYSIELDNKQREMLGYYCGNIPYLWNIEKNRKNFGFCSTTSNVASFSHTVDIIVRHWDMFKTFLNNASKAEWEPKLWLCANARNAYTHNLDRCLASTERTRLTLIAAKYWNSATKAF